MICPSQHMMVIPLPAHLSTLTYQPLDNSNTPPSTSLQLPLSIRPVRIHRPHGIKILRKLRPQLDGVIIRHIQGSLSIVPSPIFLVKSVEG